MQTENKALALLLLVGVATAAPSVTGQHKIVGGEETTIEDVPYQLELQAAVLGVLWSFSCGAVIIGNSSVVTAGHCVDGRNAKNLRILAGSTTRGDGVIHTVEVATLHPDYVDYRGSAQNDVAYLKVTPAFDLNSATTRAIALTDTEPAEGDDALISGWGVTSETSSNPPSIVRKVTVPIISRNDCIADYGADFIKASMICAGLEQGGKDSCSGDSGGPLVVNGALAGLVSWGQGCAEAGYPGVYTNVNEFKDWINEQVALNDP